LLDATLKNGEFKVVDGMARLARLFKMGIEE
jgi:hypothetical protein